MFPMTVGPMTEGTIGDALSYHSGAAFSTFDSDHDTYSGSCAGAYGGGWWYESCYQANLNGPYVAAPGMHAPDAGGIDWLPSPGRTQSMASTVMMIR